MLHIRNSISVVNTTMNNNSFCKADKKICIPLVSHLLSDKSALDVALETLWLTLCGVSKSMILTAGNVNGINLLAVFGHGLRKLNSNVSTQISCPLNSVSVTEMEMF